MEPETKNTSTSDPFRIAIIGGGPKGLYGFERLVANLAQSDAVRPVEIHVFNRNAFFGAGDIYRTDQPPYLLMNYSNGYISMWPEDAPAPVVKEPLNLVDWINATQTDKHVDNNDFSARALVGQYLRSGFDRMCKAVPQHVSVHAHVHEVCSLLPVGEKFEIDCGEASATEQHFGAFDQVLLATGHPRPSAASDQQLPEAVQFVPFVYPVDEKLKDIEADATVVIKGMGLTFIDTALALTEGRGGVFEEGNDGKLNYVASGEEPKVMYPYSTSGQPIFPRMSTFDMPAKHPVYFNMKNLKELQRQKGKEQLCFSADLWPLIRQEIIAAYYTILFEKYDQKLVMHENYQEVQAQIEDFHKQHSGEKHFEIGDLFFPIPEDTTNRHDETVACIRRQIDAAAHGETGNPLAAAAGMWRHLSDTFNGIYCFGGITAESHETFLKKYHSNLMRITYGPPLVNMEKMMALCEAGYVNFSYARAPMISMDEEKGKARIASPSQAGVSFGVLIDARIPKTDVKNDPSPLYTHLLEAGIVRPYVHSTPNGAKFEPGCIDLDENGHAINKEGNTVKTITATGNPTEGITFDNDSLARNRNDFVSNWAKEVCAHYEKA